MKQREFTKICKGMADTCIFMSIKCETENKKKLSKKFDKLTKQFIGLSEIKINKRS